MLKRAYRQLRYAIRLARAGGLKVLFQQLWRQIYSKATFIGLERSLDTNGIQVPCQLEYSFYPATEKDMEEVLEKAATESRASAHELIQRKWFYESGFRNCYVARTSDTGELCHMQWIVSPKDEPVMRQGFKKRLPRLKEEEVLLENMYTFEKYRGNRITPSAITRLAELARNNGYKRMITYVRQDNTASLKGCQRAGFKKFEEIPELKLLFFTKRKHSQGSHAEDSIG